MRKLINTGLVVGFAFLLGGCNTATTIPDPAAKVNPKAASYNVQLGMAYLKEGNRLRARRKLLLALKQGPKMQETYDAMGYFLEKTDQPEQADYYYRKALSFNERNGNSQNNYAAFLCRQGRYNDAIQHFMVAVKDPDYLTPDMAYQNAGYCAMQIPNRALAKQFFQKSVDQNPNQVLAYLELGQIAYDNQQYQQANDYLQSYARLAPPGPESLWLRVRVDQKLGNLDQAGSNALLLENKFPQSAEAKLAKASQIL